MRLQPQRPAGDKGVDGSRVEADLEARRSGPRPGPREEGPRASRRAVAVSACPRQPSGGRNQPNFSRDATILGSGDGVGARPARNAATAATTKVTEATRSAPSAYSPPTSSRPRRARTNRPWLDDGSPTMAAATAQWRANAPDLGGERVGDRDVDVRGEARDAVDRRRDSGRERGSAPPPARGRGPRARPSSTSSGGVASSASTPSAVRATCEGRRRALGSPGSRQRRCPATAGSSVRKSTCCSPDHSRSSSARRRPGARRGRRSTGSGGRVSCCAQPPTLGPAPPEGASSTRLSPTPGKSAARPGPPGGVALASRAAGHFPRSTSDPRRDEGYGGEGQHHVGGAGARQGPAWVPSWQARAPTSPPCSRRRREAARHRHRQGCGRRHQRRHRHVEAAPRRRRVRATRVELTDHVVGGDARDLPRGRRRLLGGWRTSTTPSRAHEASRLPPRAGRWAPSERWCWPVPVCSSSPGPSPRPRSRAATATRHRRPGPWQPTPRRRSSAEPEELTPPRCCQESQPQGEWRVQIVGRKMIQRDGTRQRHREVGDAVTWTIPAGTCTDSGCTGTISSSSGDRSRSCGTASGSWPTSR